ncbi:hypothetical protein NIES30_03775 [Phormidium tenue NIES-30]|uniref:SLH domain-containing protein n=2 Tax=Phormidium tenue TaxID=126344 RepID=A0A1U7J8Q1_9CYAN|nr:hypothetical protein NIES30_03775 [Phormidium tenue NIES-30]
MLAGLLAIATALTLIAWTSKQPVDAEVSLMPTTSPPPGRSLKRLFYRPYPQPSPLTVPPPVLPQPLPPQQAWPELPLRQTQPNFDDLNTEHWAWPLLADLAQRDLLSGFPDGTFRPGAAMTRAEFAAQLAQLNLSPDRASTPGQTWYPDVGPDHWAYSSVQRSVKMGFLSGHPGGDFLPNQPVSRIQVIVALANGLALTSSRAATEALVPYADRDQVPIWAIRQLVAATEAGLVVNYPEPTVLAPNRPASRAEVAAMLQRSLVYTGSLQAIPSPYIVEKAELPSWHSN